MGMAGDNAHQYLVKVLDRIEYDSVKDTITVKGDDWRNMVAAYRIAYNITATDDEVEGGDAA